MSNNNTLFVRAKSRTAALIDTTTRTVLDSAMLHSNKKLIKHDFPIFINHPELIYLDSAATSQKPQKVIDAVTAFYEKYNANVHRGIYTLSQDATNLYEMARATAASFIGETDSRNIIFTKNTSEAINMVAFGWGRKYLRPGDVVVTSEMEHHSNLVPWLCLKEQMGIKIHYLPLTEDFRLDYKSLFTANIDLKRVKLVTLSQASNVLGTVNPLADIITYYKSQGIEAKYMVDAAQSVPHMTLHVGSLGCDFLAFSAHKMVGPAGVGALWAKEEILKAMDPFEVGSHMISRVMKDKATWAEIPDKFEMGTGNMEGVVGFSAAINYLEEVGMHNIFHHELELINYTLDCFKSVDGITLYGPNDASNRLGVFSFNFDKAHAHDVAEILNRYQIAVRSGHHCAQPLMDILNVSATVRASLYLYNTKEDIDMLCTALENVKKTLKL